MRGLTLLEEFEARLDKTTLVDLPQSEIEFLIQAHSMGLGCCLISENKVLAVGAFIAMREMEESFGRENFYSISKILEGVKK